MTRLGIMIVFLFASPTFAEGDDSLLLLGNKSRTSGELARWIFGADASRQHRAYRSIELASSNVDSQRPRRVGLPIQFEFDSDRIRSSSHGFLIQIAEVMARPEAHGKRMVVEGHTDATGTVAYNDDLSKRRAEAVVRFLVAEAGVSKGRLVVVGRGEDQLLQGVAPLDHPLHRRVEFYAAD